MDRKNCNHQNELPFNHNINHVAIICDGNRRWAKQNNFNKSQGHKQGFNNVAPRLLALMCDLNIHTITFWCLSTENMVFREKDELKNLFVCYDTLLKQVMKLSNKEKIRIVHLGSKNRIPQFLANTLDTSEHKTRENTKHVFNIAIDYGGRNELYRAISKIFLNKQPEIKQSSIAQYLDTHNQPFPNPDIIIRPGGEKRLSGFMIWQSVYSEIFFLDKYFPEIKNKDILEILKKYLKRNRRFGK